MTGRFIVYTLLCCCCCSNALADAPLPPPEAYTVTSPSQKFVGEVHPKDGVTVRDANSRTVIWKAPKVWSRVAFLTDDGEHLVTGYDGRNLIPKNYDHNLVLITFWRKEQKISEVTVREMFPNPSILVETVSHFHWGRISGITDNTLTVERCDGKKLRFDIASSKGTD